MPAAKKPASKSTIASTPDKKVTEKVTEKVAEKVLDKVADKKVVDKKAKPVVASTSNDNAKSAKTPQSTTATGTAESTETNIVANVADDFTQFINKFQSMISQFSSLKAELRIIEKKTTKELKIAQKLTNKKKRKGTRAPSGFVKPAPISNELADFLGLNHGSEMARTDVTREINKYIREHSLQDSNNGRKINPDQKLSQLLNVTPEIELTYFNLQKYMGPHFPKKIIDAVAAATAVVAAAAAAAAAAAQPGAVATPVAVAPPS
tara:strand:- start:2584 stop:3375 length:792 start_codon:yes stop_codon:yes gene_type:complete